MIRMLGDEIRKERLRVGLSQEKLAEKADIHRTYVGQIEHDLKSPTIPVFLRISKALGVDASTLLERVEECGDLDSCCILPPPKVAIHTSPAKTGGSPSTKAIASRSCGSSRRKRST